MTSKPDSIELIGSDYLDDPREPYGVCRWCGADNADRHGLALIHQDEDAWYECGWCSRAIGDYELFDIDADEIRARAAEIREREEPA